MAHDTFKEQDIAVVNDDDTGTFNYNDPDAKHTIGSIANGVLSSEIETIKKFINSGKSKGQLSSVELISLEMLFNNRLKHTIVFIEDYFKNLRNLLGVPGLENQIKLMSEHNSFIKSENVDLRKQLEKLQKVVSEQPKVEDKIAPIEQENTEK